MAEDRAETTCIVVGAGIAGLLAARKLKEHGYSVKVIDKGKKVGGRMATRHIGSTVFDVGAQYFTVRDDHFAMLINAWRNNGYVEEWGRGFESADHRVSADGHPRYRVTPYMRALPERLAENLDVQCATKIAAVAAENGSWKLEDANGNLYSAQTLLMTAPAPQSLALLKAGDVTLNEAASNALEAIEYDPCIALLVELDGPSALPEPGGIRTPSDTILWMADNHAKGISPEGYGVTIHGCPEFSRDYYDADDAYLEKMLLGGAYEYLNADVLGTHLHRWRYSQTARCHPELYMAVDAPAPLVFAGDGFGGPRVEGAALSGLAAAEAIIHRA